MKRRVSVEAAGGVVLREKGSRQQVLVVHRPRRDDWSLPKGKLDPGEKPRAAALREVHEETGVRARLEHKLGAQVYRVPSGNKRVRWYLMTPLDGDPTDRAPDEEISKATWWSLDKALRRLTYDRDKDLLEHAVKRWRRSR